MKNRPNIYEQETREKIIGSLSDIFQDYVVVDAKELATYAFDNLNIFDNYQIIYGLQENKDVDWGYELPHPSIVSAEDRYDFDIYEDLCLSFFPQNIIDAEIHKWAAGKDMSPSFKVGDTIMHNNELAEIKDINQGLAEYILLSKGKLFSVGFESI